MTVGMVPMSMALEAGSQMQAPLGRAVIGGLIMSTLATLLIVPSIFALVLGNSHPAFGLGASRRRRKPRTTIPENETAARELAGSTHTRDILMRSLGAVARSDRLRLRKGRAAGQGIRCSTEPRVQHRASHGARPGAHDRAAVVRRCLRADRDLCQAAGLRPEMERRHRRPDQAENEVLATLYHSRAEGRGLRSKRPRSRWTRPWCASRRSWSKWPRAI